MRLLAGRMWPVVTTFCAVILTAAPAVAADEIAAAFSPTAVTIGVGGAPVTVALTLTNTSAAPGTAGFTISMPAELVAQGVQFTAAAAGCQAAPTVVTCPVIPVAAASNTAVTVSIAPPAQSALTSGQTVAGSLSAAGSFLTTAAGAITATVPVTLNGPVSTGIPSVTGRVLDLETKPVPGAVVTITDSAGKSRGVTSGDTGAFTYTAASVAEQFTAGTLTLVATKTGYTPVTVTRTATPGLAVSDVDISLTLTAAAAPNAVQRIEKSPVAGAADGDDGSPMLTFAVILGVLLLGGGGACVYFLLRKGRDGDEGPARPTPTVYRSSTPSAPQRPDHATQILRTVPAEPAHAPPSSAHEPTVRHPAAPTSEPTAVRHPAAALSEPTVVRNPSSALSEPTAVHNQPAPGLNEPTALRKRPGREPKPWDWLDD
ncbi:hypothetical protein Lfu02_43260 [Longispora fulva]|uniref:Carboxypeptidase regulatory-like domain-containing protein n=1 Tax=Longispora fulva TaxID=619741 RepID=A0A8J7GRE0_9ACTN|nr:carboxypeptidase-like regulatory domain-containing protein [Longispora fulva]MBG6136783.1 hypothetical protein [Longispora fulva]GIG59954.1 hypothetical protein Lfu02_43260 [Longispora fulva]